MTDKLPNRREIEDLIRAKLIELIDLSVEHGIDIQTLIDDALHICRSRVRIGRAGDRSRRHKLAGFSVLQISLVKYPGERERRSLSHGTQRSGVPRRRSVWLGRAYRLVWWRP